MFIIIGTFISLLGVYITYSGEKQKLVLKGLIYAIGAAVSWAVNILMIEGKVYIS